MLPRELKCALGGLLDEMRLPPVDAHPRGKDIDHGDRPWMSELGCDRQGFLHCLQGAVWITQIPKNMSREASGNHPSMLSVG